MPLTSCVRVTVPVALGIPSPFEKFTSFVVPSARLVERDKGLSRVDVASSVASLVPYDEP